MGSFPTTMMYSVTPTAQIYVPHASHRYVRRVRVVRLLRRALGRVEIDAPRRVVQQTGLRTRDSVQRTRGFGKRVAQRLLGVRTGLEEMGHTEIADFYVIIVGKEKVLGLNVAMNYFVEMDWE